jgi:cell division protein ZapA (FtsZ GTPase activity inhibitor)
MNDELGIQVNIGGKVYRLRCKRSEEQLYRIAVRQINDKILQYQSVYTKGVELNDLLAMVSLHFSLNSVKTEKNEDIEPVFEKLDDLNSDLMDFIKENGL